MKRAVTVLLFVCAAARAQNYYPPSDAAGGWRVLDDAAKIRKTAGSFEYSAFVRAGSSKDGHLTGGSSGDRGIR